MNKEDVPQALLVLSLAFKEMSSEIEQANRNLLEAVAFRKLAVEEHDRLRNTLIALEKQWAARAADKRRKTDSRNEAYYYAYDLRKVLGLENDDF